MIEDAARWCEGLLVWGTPARPHHIAAVLVVSLNDARWMLIEAVASHLDRQDAEREALNEGRATIQNIKSQKIETKIDARGVGHSLAINNAPVETVRLVQVRTPNQLIEGIPPRHSRSL